MKYSMKKRICDLLGLVALASITIGGFHIHDAVGYIIGGLSLLLVALVIAWEPVKP